LAVPGFAHVSVTTLAVAPFELVRVTAGLVPFGALTKPAPFPVFCFTVTVIVWFLPTSFVADGGEMAMLASTYVFVAGPEPPGPAPMLAVAGSVSRLIEMPPTDSVTAAFPTTLPV